MKKRVNAKAKDLPSIPLTPTIFKQLTAYLLSDYRSRSFVGKLELFFNTVNCNLYAEDGDLEIYYRVIRRVIRLCIDSNVDHSEIIVSHLLESPNDGDEIQGLFEKLVDELEELDSNSSRFIENEIISRLNFINVNATVSDLKVALSKYETQDFTSYAEGVSLLSGSASNLVRSVIAKESSNLSIPDVSYQSEDAFQRTISNVRRSMNDEKRVIKTGIRRLNKMLNGGFQPGRVYLINAISGGWKSGLLLNACFWAAKYNDKIVCNDRSKRPCILYITQENDLTETVEREISYVGGVDDNGKAVSEEELTELFITEKLYKGKWVFVKKYRPKRSISTGDLDTIIAEVEAEENVEVKMLVHDYVKRIAPDFPTGDVRIDLGEVNLVASSSSNVTVKAF